jgi:hypothetical protein
MVWLADDDGNSARSSGTEHIEDELVILSEILTVGFSMLPEGLKTDVLEIAEIAKACPDNLQERCFELLLSRYLEGLAPTAPAKNGKTEQSLPPNKGNDSTESAPNPNSNGNADQDLALADLHVKARKFLEKYQRTIADLNQLFYKDGDELKPLYEDLKTTKVSESQIRIALLAALKEGIQTGDFIFDGEAVRSECQVRKCYDKANFAATFKRNATLFDGFEAYDSEASKIRLSESGKEMLSGLIVELR